MKKYLLIALCLSITVSCNKASSNYVVIGNYEIKSIDKTLSFFYKGKPVFEHVNATYVLDGKTISTKDYKNQEVRQRNIVDKIGEGKEFSVQYSENKLPDLILKFSLYKDVDYIFTEFVLESVEDIEVNYMSVINVDHVSDFLGEGEKRALFVPFDNDKWVRFKSHAMDFDTLTSYEVTTVFNNDSRVGLVIGSVEHNSWKTGIRITADSGKIRELNCYGGIADTMTRDVKPHGALKGKTIKSPKIMIGIFDDWRAGMETFAHANNAVNPRKAFNKPVPFGWNSWGALQFRLTAQKALEVSDYFKNNLQNNNFLNADSMVVIGLDSGWNSFTEDQLKEFVARCKANGQIAGVYWVPFTDWGKRPERTIKDAPDYKYGDAYVYANGKPQDLDGAYALDPTHPAVEAQMKKTSELFKRCGFEFVKMDFMTHGALEGDKWHRPEIRTGMQAYNYGMQLLNKYFGDMFINLSISPIFPTQYAQSRRIACDAWNKIKDTEYTMNAVSYGWWVGSLYNFNDADHILLRDATEGENRARVTSSAITGLYIAGDDFSEEGPAESKERAAKFLTNADVNAVAQGVTFHPIEGANNRCENQFVRITDSIAYYAVFNYGEKELNLTIPFDRLGIDRVELGKELWSGDTIQTAETLTVPGKDVKLIKFDLKK